MMNTEFNPLTYTYDTKDGTNVAAEVCDSVECLADVFHIANIRQTQREQMKGLNNEPIPTSR
jgi:hypothetical protein